MFNNIYKNKKVLITGHSGFKGSWLTQWLLELGANVIGISDREYRHFYLLNLNKKIETYDCDINDFKKLYSIIDIHNPEIIFHLCAQPLVKISFDTPLDTYKINIMGTINLFEACRKVDSVKAIINITTDKIFKDINKQSGYTEEDSLGGYDPYSCSKACSELITHSYRDSFFKDNVLIATGRAGNVIGGGDWSDYRLIPDLIKSTIHDKEIIIRNLKGIRPYQHVLPCLEGYLLLGQKLLEGKKEFATAFNFGPQDTDIIDNEYIIKAFEKHWKKIKFKCTEKELFHETNVLKLDSTKARALLGWKPKYNIDQTLEKTIMWYKEHYDNNKVITVDQIKEYMNEY